MWAIGSNLGATVEMGAQRHREYLATGGTAGYIIGYCRALHGLHDQVLQGTQRGREV